MCCTVLLTLLFLCITILLWKKYRDIVRKQHVSTAQDQSDSKKKDGLDIALWILVPITGILVLNLLFVFFEKLEFSIESTMSYNDTLLMTISLAGTIVIAYFQYRLQKSIDAKDEMNDKIQKEQEIRKHKSELRSERIRSLDILNKRKIYGINYNIVSAQIDRYEIPSNPFWIIVGDDDDVDSPCFYHPYFELKNVDIAVLYGENKEYRKSFDKKRMTPHSIELDFDVNAKDFFIYPSYHCKNSNKAPVMSIKIEVEAVDKSICFEDNADTEVDVKYTLEFDLIPSEKYGYKRDGTFDLDLKNVKISL